MRTSAVAGRGFEDAGAVLGLIDSSSASAATLVSLLRASPCNLPSVERRVPSKRDALFGRDVGSTLVTAGMLWSTGLLELSGTRSRDAAR